MNSVSRIGEIIGLSNAEVAELLNLGAGTPELSPEEKARVGRVLELTELLEKKLKPGQVPAAFRRPAAVFGDISLLEMIRSGREAAALASVRRSFDWSGTA